MIKMTQTFTRTITYEIGKGFMIDIVDNKETWEVWLYHKKIGIKDFMFGLPKEETKYNDLKEIIINNLENETYLDDYMYEYA